MGNKVVQVGLVVVGIIVVILLLTVIMPIFTDLVVTANASRADWSMYPGAQGFLVGAPWYIYFTPVIVGIALIVFILKKGG